MKKVILLCCVWFNFLVGFSQSIEIMPGNNFVFTDVQFLKPFDKQFRTTIFSRTRARLTYDDEANGIDFFSGAYFNHTLKSGLGGSIIGRFNNTGSDLDVGVHFFKETKTISLFALPSVSLSTVGTWSWFSIFRFRPKLNENWKWYIGIELFTAFDKADHLASTQRIRLGLDYQSYQFGLAMNITEVGGNLIVVNDNYGVFLRKEF